MSQLNVVCAGAIFPTTMAVVRKYTMYFGKIKDWIPASDYYSCIKRRKFPELFPYYLTSILPAKIINLPPLAAVLSHPLSRPYTNKRAR